MIVAREENLGSTRTERWEMRSPHHQEMDRADMTMDNCIQETCYIRELDLAMCFPSSNGSKMRSLWTSPSKDQAGTLRILEET